MERARGGSCGGSAFRWCYFEAVRRIVVSEFISVDGVMEDPGGSERTRRGGWVSQFNRGDDGDKFKLAELTSTEALLLGRKTYEGFAEAWPGRTDDVGFAEKMNSMSKYVVSHTLRHPSWNNTTVIGGGVPAQLAGVKKGGGGDLPVHSQCPTGHALVEDKLVAPLRPMVFSVRL